MQPLSVSIGRAPSPNQTSSFDGATSPSRDFSGEEPGDTASPTNDRTTRVETANNPTTGITVVPKPWYYPLRALSHRPMPIDPIQPEYPSDAQNIAGRVILAIYLNETGGIDNFTIISAEPPGTFTRSALKAFLSATYTPGRVSTVPVKSVLVVEVSFTPGEEPTTTVVSSQPTQHPIP